MSMENRLPRPSRVVVPERSPRTEPEPAISGCFAGSVRTAKIAAGGAAIVLVTDTWRPPPAPC